MDLQSIATFIGLILTGIGLIYAGIQLRDSKRITQGDFLLRLDEALRHHDDVHKKLRPGGDWAPLGSGLSSSGSGSTGSTPSASAIGPNSNDDWLQVEIYMGLFERIKILADGGMVDLKTINRLYGYRVTNIVSNGKIREEKLVSHSDSWRDFIELARALKRYPYG